MRENPIPVTAFSPLDTSTERIEALIRDVKAGDEDRRDWLQKQSDLTKQRFGIRQTKRAVPWAGASDLRIPTQDKTIRRWKPKILSLIFDADPIAFFRALAPGDIESARLVEVFHDWQFKVNMEESLEELCILVDLIAHRGHALLQVSWDYRTEDETRVLDVADFWPAGLDNVSDDEIVQTLQDEYDLGPEEIAAELIADIRSGAQRVVLQFQAIVADRPRVTARDPVQVITSARTASLEDAPFICVQHIVDLPMLRAWARDGRLDPAAVDQLVAQFEDRVAPGGDRGQLPAQDRRNEERSLLDDAEGVSTDEDLTRLEVWEIYAWAEAPERRRVVYWIHPGTKIVLAAHPYPFPFHGWPFVKFDFEKTFQRRWNASRGISRMLSPLAKSINRLHNARLDAIALQLVPALKMKTPGGTPPRAFQFGPGKIFQVNELNDIEPLNQDLRNIPLYTQEEYSTRQYAEDYAGVYDSSLMAAPAERRTATEVQYVSEQMQGSFSLDAKLFQTAMAKVHRMIWQLWYEFGAEEVFFRVLDERQPQLFKKSEVARNYDITPSGTPANTNKAIELARAREAMQLLASDQSGVLKKDELYSYYLGLLDWKLAKRIVRGSEEQRAYQTLMGAANEIASGNLQTIMQQAMAAQAAQAQGAAVPGAPMLS